MSATSAFDPARATAGSPLLEAVGLSLHFQTRRLLGLARGQAIRAVDGVDLEVLPGETFGLVGESGCGKSTLARVLVGLLRPTYGTVRFRGQSLNLTGAGERDLRRQVQIIFQDPYSSLNPSFPIRTILNESYRLKGVRDRATRERDLAELMERVGLRKEFLDRYPHQLSGGQRQRVVIARALAPGPRLIVADEPVSALDVSVQSQILNLMIELQQELGLTYLFISHDLNVVRYICDRVAVMYLGRIVEVGPTEEILTSPRHPYTEGLLSGLPSLHGPDGRAPRILAGDLPSPLRIPPGCRFHPRCPYAKENCPETDPALAGHADGWEVACHYPVEP